MIKEFLEFQRINKALREESVQGYAKELKAFIRWALREKLTWSTLTAADMDRFVKSENERGMKPRTIRKRVEVVRLMLTWACHTGQLNTNAAQYTQVPKIREELPKAANEEQVRRYLETPATSKRSYEIHAITAIIYETGLRLGEVLKLTANDIDVEAQSIWVHDGKGGNERVVFYSQYTSRYTTELTKRMGTLFNMSDIDVRYSMYHEMPGVHPHAIRHLFATLQLNKGMSLKNLSYLMGHKHESTTEIYAKVNPTAARQQYFNFN